MTWCNELNNKWIVNRQLENKEGYYKQNQKQTTQIKKNAAHIIEKDLISLIYKDHL